MASEVSSSSPYHFVLLHGVGHGAWCWFKLRHLLEESGHEVSCMDLSGAGINISDPNSVLTFDEYNKPFLDFLSALPQHEKVVLVGHSAGGLSATQAVREFGDKIAVAIYVAATMLRSGFYSEEDIKEGVPNLPNEMLELNFGLGPNKPPTSTSLLQQFQRQILYQLSPMEDSTLASMLLRPWPSTALANAKFEGGEENVDKVRRVFIKTKHDNMLSLEQQEAMVKRWPPSEVMVVESDHCPFFSAPGKLLHLLLKAVSRERDGGLSRSKR